MTLQYRIGWDVGAWHCTRHKGSQDALVALEVIDGAPRIFGNWWRDNLSDHLHLEGDELLLKVLSLCGISPTQSAELTIAIDTPLGWPNAMMTLAAGGAAASVPADDAENRYTRRQTEIELAIEARTAMRSDRPFSAVRDMIGSQSTKGLHFLRAAGLNADTPGVWRGGGEKLAVTVIETYPAEAIRRDRRLYDGLIENIRPPVAAGEDALKDVRDALMCAVVAHLYADVADSTDPVPAEVPAGEGWIIVPRAVAANRTP